MQAPVSDISGYLKTIFGLQDTLKDGKVAWYRGHGRWDYRLTPSLFRKHDESGSPLYPHGEFEMVQDVLSAHPDEFAQDSFMIDKLARMQHFGLPTRLLDITANPLMALYFAAEKNEKLPEKGEGEAGEDVEIDGEVVVLTVPADDVKYYDSDTVSCIANLCMLRAEQREKIGKAIREAPDGASREALADAGSEAPVDVAAFNSNSAMRPLLDAVKREKSYFQDQLAPEDLQRILFVRGRRSNPRIEAQSGAFILFGLEAPEIEVLPGEITLHRIPVRNKARIRQELAALNITAQTIYPSLEKTAAAVARLHLSEG